MKTQSGLLKTINTIINFFWNLQILFTIIVSLAIFFIPTFFEVKLSLKENGQFLFENDETYPIKIVDLTGMVEFNEDNFPMIYTEHFFLIVVLLLSLFLFYHFKKIINSITKNNSFEPINSKRFRYMGLSLFAMILVETLHFFFVQQKFIPLIQHKAVEINTSYSFIDHFDWYALFGGLIFLVLAEAFKEGFSLKQETELTI